jgi:DNA-binding NtrC family response regulator
MPVTPHNTQRSFAAREARERTVFLLEDDPLIMTELVETLEDFGWAVSYKASNLEDGLRFAQHGAFGVAILDIRIGEGDSKQVARAVRRRRIPLVLCTGYSSPSLLDKYPDVRILEKPFSAEKLRVTLEEVWTMPSPTKSARKPTLR